MVKSALDRIQKAQLKFDPYVNQLRAKAMLYRNIEMFARSAKMQEVLDLLLDNLDLGYALNGKARDLAWKLYSGKTVTLEDWLAAGLSESLYDLLLAELENIKSRYEFYLYPFTMLCSTVEITELTFEQMYDDADNIVNKIAVDIYANKIVRVQSPLFVTKVGYHTPRIALAPFLNLPSVRCQSDTILLILNSVCASCDLDNLVPSLGNNLAQANLNNLAPSLNTSVIIEP